jgi:hypothetical protein
MTNGVGHTYQPVLLQAQHWTAAARRLGDLDALASKEAWESTERYLKLALREKLSQSVKRLVEKGERLIQHVLKVDTNASFSLQQEIELFKNQYLKVETILDFFSHALSTRTTRETIAMMRACDQIAESSMTQILVPLGHPVPPVLVYIDKGLGASILKAGLQLWDGYTNNPVAAIKVTRHNLLRPTALIHEAGHQVAHITGWNQELERALHVGLKDYGEEVQETWSGWASEMAADALAFAYTGFASVAALHDVVDGPTGSVMRYLPGDPHPICYLRVLLGIECCRLSFGEGPWDDMRVAWMKKHPLENAVSEITDLFRISVEALPAIARIVLHHPLRAFKGRALSAWIDPANVAPEKLERAATVQGESYYRSHYLAAENPLQKIAWNGYRVATTPLQVDALLQQQQEWMLKLGKSI